MLQSVMFLPTIMSPAVMGLVFYLLFNAYNGEVNIMLKSLGLISRNVNWLGKDHAMQTLIITAVWGGLGRPGQLHGVFHRRLAAGEQGGAGERGDRRREPPATRARAASMKITPRGCLSRSAAGIRGRSLIINLPGSPKAARENLLAVVEPIKHGLDMLVSEGSADCAGK